MRALLINDASLSGHHGSALVTERLQAFCALHKLDALTGWDWKNVLSQCRSDRLPFDMAIVNGEGSIHHNSKCARRIAETAIALRERGVPAYLVNASIEACDEDIFRGLAAFRLCFVRDTASQNVLAAAGVPAHVVADLTLTTPFAASAADAMGPLVLTDASEDTKTAVLAALAKRWPHTRMLTLRCPPPWPKRGSSARKLMFELKRVAAKPAALSPWSLRYAGAMRSRDELLAGLQASSGVISARYHGVCLTLLLRRPFLAVEGNTGKTGALLRDIGLHERSVPLSELAAMTAPPLIPALSPGELQAIEAFLARTRAGADAMFARIAADARAAIEGELAGARRSFAA